MNLLLFEEKELTEDRTLRLEGRRAEHLFCVLHAKAGDSLRAGMLGGGLGRAEVLECTRHSALLRADPCTTPPPPPREIVPVIALPRPQSFKKTLHFIASCGIRKAYFTGAEKVEKSYWKSDAVQEEHIRSELILGLEQGGTTILPDIRFRPHLRSFLAGEEMADLKSRLTPLLAHPRNAEKCPAQTDGRILLAIGPEGGFSDAEVDLFTAAGFRAVEIGPWILRVEFALSFLCGRLLV